VEEKGRERREGEEKGREIREGKGRGRPSRFAPPEKIS